MRDNAIFGEVLWCPRTKKGSMGNVSNRLAQWAKWGRSWEELEDGHGTIGGVRQTDKDGIRLFIPCDSVVGSAIDPTGTGAEVVDWLYGISDSGKHIALRNCMAVSTLSDSQELSASTMLSGNEAFDTSASISKISFGLQHLEDWAVQKTDNGDNVFQAFLKDHSSSRCIEQMWYTDDRLKIIVRAGMNLKCNLPASVNLEQCCRLDIEFASQESYEDADDVAFSILLLVSFCAGWYASLDSMTVTNCDGVTYEVTETLGRKNYDWIKPQSSPIPYNVFADRSQQLIDKWLHCEGDLKIAIHEYVPIALLRRQSYLDFEYIAASQIIETLGRAVDEKNSTASSEHKEMMARLKAAAENIEDEELREWVFGQIADKTRPTLRQSLKGLYDFVGTYSKEVFPKREKFADLQCRRRNPFMHRRAEVEKYSDDYLFFHTKGLFMLSEAAIMRLLGFTQEEVNDLLAKSHSCYLISKLQNKA